jgi:hypothetical protein
MSMTPRRVSAEDRLSLALAAEARERRNRPRAAVVLCGVLLAGAAVYQGVGAASYGASRRAQERDVARAGELAGEVARLRHLREQAAVGAQPAGGGITRVSEITALATRAGMRAPPNPPSERVTRQGPGGQLKTITYARVADPSLAALLKWVDTAAAQIDGLRIDTITIAPDERNRQWMLDVWFERWERSG